MTRPVARIEAARKLAAQLEAEGRFADAETVNALCRSLNTASSSLSVLWRDNVALRRAGSADSQQDAGVLPSSDGRAGLKLGQYRCERCGRVGWGGDHTCVGRPPPPTPTRPPAILSCAADVPAWQAPPEAERPDGFDTLIADAKAEAAKAMRKFPQPNYVISKVAEEAGEVVKAAIHCAEGREDVAELRGEMKQLIAMLYRLWVEGDGVHGLPPVAPLPPAPAKGSAS